MSDVGQIMREFTDAYGRDGAADPRDYLRRVEGVDREELRMLIEGFLTQAPRQEWDADTFRGSLAAKAIEGSGFAYGWPTLLPELRTKAKLSRSKVVERLAAALGFGGSEQRVAAYYHRMEHGDLVPSGVSAIVLEKLGEIVGTTGEVLRRAGAVGEASSERGGEVFARLGSGASAFEAVELSHELRIEHPDAVQPDELDQLFTGGE